MSTADELLQTVNEAESQELHQDSRGARGNEWLNPAS